MPIGNLNVVYNAVLDAYEETFNKKNLNKNKFVQIKTCKQNLVNRPGDIYRFKNMNWWAQNKLSGVKKLVCGITMDSTAVSVEAVDVDELPYSYLHYDPDAKKNLVSMNLLFLCELFTMFAGISLV